MAEGKGKKGADPALRAAAVGMADKAVAVRDAGAALLNELLGQLGQEAVVAAAGLLVSADKKLAMEALAKVLGGPVSAGAGGSAAAAAAAGPSSRPGTSAAGGRAGAAGTRAGAAGSRPGTARAPPAAAPAAAAALAPAPEAGGPILAYSEGKAERARKVRLGQQVAPALGCVLWPSRPRPATHSSPSVCPLPQYRPRPGKFEGVAPEEAEALARELQVSLHCRGCTPTCLLC